MAQSFFQTWLLNTFNLSWKVFIGFFIVVLITILINLDNITCYFFERWEGQCYIWNFQRGDSFWMILNYSAYEVDRVDKQVTQDWIYNHYSWPLRTLHLKEWVFHLFFPSQTLWHKTYTVLQSLFRFESVQTYGEFTPS